LLERPPTEEPEATPEESAVLAESVLVAQAVNRDEDAFARLYDEYYDRIYRHVYYRVGPNDAEDVTQQVFLQAWQAIGRFQQTTAPFVAWLFTIAHNAIVSFYRKNKGSFSLDADLVKGPSEDGIEGGVENRLEHERARRAMARLNPEQQQVLAMRFLEDLSPRDVSLALGKSEGNVRVIQHRALRELRRLMDREER
jgi:RNA polymerase sigma-70 factor (ECF subfamily)